MIKYYRKKGTDKATHESYFHSRTTIGFGEINTHNFKFYSDDCFDQFLKENGYEEIIENTCDHPEIFKGQDGCTYGKCAEFTGKVEREKVARALEEIKKDIELGKVTNWMKDLNLLNSAQNLVNAIESLKVDATSEQKGNSVAPDIDVATKNDVKLPEVGKRYEDVRSGERLTVREIGNGRVWFTKGTWASIDELNNKDDFEELPEDNIEIKPEWIKSLIVAVDEGKEGGDKTIYTVREGNKIVYCGEKNPFPEDNIEEKQTNDCKHKWVLECKSYDKKGLAAIEVSCKKCNDYQHIEFDNHLYTTDEKLTASMRSGGKSKIPQFIIVNGKKEETQVWIDELVEKPKSIWKDVSELPRTEAIVFVNIDNMYSMPAKWDGEDFICLEAKRPYRYKVKEWLYPSDLIKIVINTEERLKKLEGR